jgi:hypothetical protein
MITEYAARIYPDIIIQRPGWTLADYARVAERNNGQVVFRLIGEWQDYTGERSDPIEAAVSETEVSVLRAMIDLLTIQNAQLVKERDAVEEVRIGDPLFNEDGTPWRKP